MPPAFRSTKSAVGLSLLLLFFLTLPILLYLIGLPSREQAWKGVPSHVGAVGDVVRTMYEEPQSVDVLFVGPSLVRRGIDLNTMEAALTTHLGRPGRVGELSMSWPGVDLQYFMLRDYLERHHPSLIVWDAPGRVSNWNGAHVQSYRWMRFGEYRDTFASMPLFYKTQVYGEMVLGAPKQLLYRVRPNLLSSTETSDRDGFDVHQSLRTGYHNTSFVPDDGPAPLPKATLLPVTSSTLHLQGTPSGQFQLKYMHELISLARQRHCSLVLLHTPTDLEYGDPGLPEIDDWAKLFGRDYEVVGIPAAELFPGYDRDRYLHFFSDGHLNANGRRVFTNAIVPAVLEAYDDAR